MSDELAIRQLLVDLVASDRNLTDLVSTCFERIRQLALIVQALEKKVADLERGEAA